MTTITTEKIEELISELYKFYGLEHWITVKGVKQPSSFDLSRSPLISRAIEMLRAMVPQPQGQALPEPCEYACIGGVAQNVWTEPKVRAYGQQCYDAGRASQLALPAGPVPEYALPEIVQAARDIVKLWDSEHVSEDDYNEEMVRIEKLFRALIGSPAVAQPVAQDRSQIQRLKDAIEGECAGLAIDDKQATTILQHVGAVAQPVADERTAFEAWADKNGFAGFRESMFAAWEARAALCPPAEEGGKS